MSWTLVTGATGTVGNAIVRHLIARGRSVRALVRDVDRARAQLPAEVSLAAGDVTDPRAVHAAMAGCSAVFHASGLPEQWQRDPRQFHRVNVDGTRAMVDAALAHRVSSFVYTSTIDVFAWRPGVPFDESIIDSAPKGTFYERSKQSADAFVTTALDRELPARFAHPAGVYGPVTEIRPGANRLLLDLARNRIPVLLPGGLPLVHADDVGAGHLMLEAAPVGTRAILSERYYSLESIACEVKAMVPAARIPKVMPNALASLIAHGGEAVAGITGRPPLVAIGELHFLRSHAVPDAARAHGLGWSARSLSEGLLDTLPALLAAAEKE